MTNLSTFGSSLIGQRIFSSTSEIHYWLASRCVNSLSDGTLFGLRKVDNAGYLNYNCLCDSSGYVRSPSYGMRIVVSVPASHMNVASDGTVTLK